MNQQPFRRGSTFPVTPPNVKDNAPHPVEVPVRWFKRLLEMKAKAEANSQELPSLYGYIESAEFIIERANTGDKDE